ncbi:hypothetical protein [Ruixingdingia sedimenti]|uniref:Uncharacterized protein n=1 Tax=Ruixingdingia sedimenti TaxID=3073604 RepID=A0ABU1FC17_9RHOB|nr:hypothetical protein [Xinfangfangia sp. LG-4]MDR5654447.1 hypothetical protein [Xinfangfangia sp. LG-4]
MDMLRSLSGKVLWQRPAGGVLEINAVPFGCGTDILSINFASIRRKRIDAAAGVATKNSG